MKKRLILSIILVSLMILTGCESKTDKLENKINELESQINDMSTSTTTVTSTTTATIFESTTTTSSSTKSTKKKTTTTTRTTTGKKSFKTWKDEKGNEVKGYEYCNEDGCKCYLNNGIPRSC